MKTKVKKYFITNLALVLILSNFSFAVTLAFCKMNSDNTVCACSHNNGTEKSELAFKRIPNTCCDTKIVELSNSNILEIINSYSGNFLLHSHTTNADNFSITGSLYNISRIYSEFSYHPPNSEIPILNSSLLI